MAGGPTQRKPFLVLKERLPAERYLDFDPPRNEMEVVWIFARVAGVLDFHVDVVRAAFPDCIARWGPRERRVRIEFESRSRHFEHHAHEASDCDLVVWWKHDWAGIPAGLQVLELRKLFGRAQDVFVQAYQDEFWRRLPPPRDRKPTQLWSVPSRAGAGDLLLIYRPETEGDEGAITDVFEVVTPVETVKSPDWRRRESRQRKRQRPD